MSSKHLHASRKIMWVEEMQNLKINTTITQCTQMHTHITHTHTRTHIWQWALSWVFKSFWMFLISLICLFMHKACNFCALCEHQQNSSCSSDKQSYQKQDKGEGGGERKLSYFFCIYSCSVCRTLAGLENLDIPSECTRCTQCSELCASEFRKQIKIKIVCECDSQS